MKTFPMLLQMASGRVAIAAGGDRAARKVRLPLKAGARLAELTGRLRSAVAARVPQADRGDLWRRVLAETPRRLNAVGAEREAARALKATFVAGTAPDTHNTGRISLVGAGPGARDLLTLRAVQRLQEADVIYYDRLVDPEVLELARRDATRVYVGKEVGACAWPQDRIDAVIVAAARQGKRVVRLKSGDPGMFGRATEELEAARAAGIAIEIVPGVTAASAAGAALGRSLTERGATDRVVFATGTCRPGDPAPDWGACLAPGTTLALYMGVGNLREIRANLLAAGVPPTAEVEIVCKASTPEERLWRGTLSSVSGITDTVNPAIILVRRRKMPALGAVAPGGAAVEVQHLQRA